MLKLLAVVVAAVLVAAAARGAEQPGEREKIETLIKAVEGMADAKFVRNGTEYDGKAAAAHMRRKWKGAEKGRAHGAGLHPPGGDEVGRVGGEVPDPV